MRRAMNACPPGPVVLVGTDIPGLTAGDIAAAYRLLGRHDVVFGPARDDGFWLVGARHLMPPFGARSLSDAARGMFRKPPIPLNNSPLPVTPVVHVGAVCRRTVRCCRFPMRRRLQFPFPR